MHDVFKVLLFFGVFIGICAVAEWIAENIPWIGYVAAVMLAVYCMSKLYKRAFRN